MSGHGRVTVAWLVVACSFVLDSWCEAQVAVTQVAAWQKISATEGGFGGTLHKYSSFGAGISALGDLNGDGVMDVAVGASDHSFPAIEPGTLWLLFLDTDGSVKSQRAIGSGLGGFTGSLAVGDLFGWSVASLGDVDGDGVGDLVVGAPGATGPPSVWILFLNPGGTVKAQQRINSNEGGMPPDLAGGFGKSVAPLGDLDGDGVPDLAVGAPNAHSPTGGLTGAVWILFLQVDGTVKSFQRIANGTSGFSGPLQWGDMFGWALGSMGDLDADGVTDLAVGAYLDDDGGFQVGAVYLLFLNSNGTVGADAKISATEGGFAGPLFQNAFFGSAVASPGDISGDGVPDLLVGSTGDGDGGWRAGAVWVLALNENGSVKAQSKISATEGGVIVPFGVGSEFGDGIGALGDLNGDGEIDLIVGATGDADGEAFAGAAYVLFLDSGPWFDLGFGMQGSGGLAPRLTGEGPVLSDQLIRIVLVDALPNAPAWLVAGTSMLQQPFKGGVLVPDPAAPGVVLPIGTGALGQVLLQGLWPTQVPPGFSAFMQMWVADPAGPFGWAASNAIQATTP